MIDISKAQREFSKEDKYIFDWFEQNGFYCMKMRGTNVRD